MIIGVDAREFVAQGKTGISRYLENLLTPLVRVPGREFVLFARRPDLVPENLRAPSVKIAVLPSLPTMLVDQVVLPRLARREKVEVFFSPYYKVPLTGQFQRIITVHDIAFLRQAGLARCARSIVKRQLQASTRKAEVILVDSDFTGKDLVDLMPGLQDKIHRLYPDLSAAWLEPLASAAVAGAQEKQLGRQPYLLYVGNFKPHKNVDLLVKAFARLVEARQADDRRLLLAGGDAVNLGRIMQLIHRHGMLNHIQVLPKVSDAELRGLYLAADWFVTASGYEGFGYPPLEAMAAGCPVICCPCTSLPEVVNGAALEIAGLTVEGIRQALRRALAMQPAERLNLAARGKQQAKRFLPGSAAANFAALLSKLARPPPASPGRRYAGL